MSELIKRIDAQRQTIAAMEEVLAEIGKMAGVPVGNVPALIGWAERAAAALSQQDTESVQEWMPIIGTCLGIPMALLDERHAKVNHGQSLARLKERGGLSLCEASAIVERKPWHRIDHKKSLEILGAVSIAKTEVK